MILPGKQHRDTRVVKQALSGQVPSWVSKAIYPICILGLALLTMTLGDANELDALCGKYSPPKACQQF